MATDMIARAMAARALKNAQWGGEGQFGLQSIEINKDGDLVITFTDGTVSNLGRVTGADGKVYVPHIDKNTSVLSWTIEDKEGEVPDPIDLSDSGEWEEIAKDKVELTNEEIESIINQMDSFINNNCYVNGKFDEDLKQDICFNIFITLSKNRKKS